MIEKLGVTVTDIFHNNNYYWKKIDILKLGIQLTKNIRELHEAGFVHLDIKPDNLMFDTPVNDHSEFCRIDNPVVNDYNED